MRKNPIRQGESQAALAENKIPGTNLTFDEQPTRPDTIYVNIAREPSHPAIPSAGSKSRGNFLSLFLCADKVYLCIPRVYCHGVREITGYTGRSMNTLQRVSLISDQSASPSAGQAPPALLRFTFLICLFPAEKRKLPVRRNSSGYRA